MRTTGRLIGSALRGGELFELVGDVGAGKTTLTKGIAEGLAIDEDIQSPTFTISRVYPARDGLELVHYDFYRLPEAGLMRMELAETAATAQTIVVVEWADVVADVLPEKRIRISIEPGEREDDRMLSIVVPPNEYAYIVEALEA